MRTGFFSLSKVTSKKPMSSLAKCGQCGLFKTCQSPKMPVSGQGRRKILFIAEAPGKTEDERGIQLIGESGKYLRKTLAALDIDLDRDCWKTNAVCCHPPKNAKPTEEMILACRPNIHRTITELQPNMIILLGIAAVQSVIGMVWKEKVKALTRWLGWTIPFQRLNVWLCPTFHPAHILHTNGGVSEKLFQAHIKNAIAKCDRRPWKEIPDYRKQVEIILDVDRAANILKQIHQKEGTISFDYESNCLKPEYKGAALYSCSVCWMGKRTIAFPWRGPVIEPMRNLLLDGNIKKVGCNIKHETRWTKVHLKATIKNWVWDTMLAAHILNNARETTSLKFQAFVELGMDGYNEHIEKLLESQEVGHLNRIKDIDIQDLLLYNGLDSLLTYKLAEKQMKDRRIEHA